MASALASACFLVGLCAISAGAWLVAPWLGLIVGGALVALASLAFLALRRLRSSFMRGEHVAP